MAILETILYGSGKLIGFVKESISWFISILPKPLKFLLFLYMVLFFGALIVPQIIGVGMSCDSQGDVYRINFVSRYFDSLSVDWKLSYCGIEGLPQQAYTPIDGIFQLFRFLKEKFTSGGSVSDYLTNSTSKESECDAFRAEIAGLNTSNEQVSRDYMLQKYGEKVVSEDYKNVVHIQCAFDEKDNEYYPSLFFYSIDIFNFEIWLVLGLFGSLVAFALWYYTAMIR
jgi:hypothetical protein